MSGYTPIDYRALGALRGRRSNLERGLGLALSVKGRDYYDVEQDRMRGEQQNLVRSRQQQFLRALGEKKEAEAAAAARAKEKRDQAYDWKKFSIVQDATAAERKAAADRAAIDDARQAEAAKNAAAAAGRVAADAKAEATVPVFPGARRYDPDALGTDEIAEEYDTIREAAPPPLQEALKRREQDLAAAERKAAVDADKARVEAERAAREDEYKGEKRQRERDEHETPEQKAERIQQEKREFAEFMDRLIRAREGERREAREPSELQRDWERINAEVNRDGLYKFKNPEIKDAEARRRWKQDHGDTPVPADLGVDEAMGMERPPWLGGGGPGAGGPGGAAALGGQGGGLPTMVSEAATLPISASLPRGAGRGSVVAGSGGAPQAAPLPFPAPPVAPAEAPPAPLPWDEAVAQVAAANPTLPFAASDDGRAVFGAPSPQPAGISAEVDGERFEFQVNPQTTDRAFQLLSKKSPEERDAAIADMMARPDEYRARGVDVDAILAAFPTSAAP